MEENKELKPKSFRVSEETAQKIKDITTELEGNQETALVKLIECYELQRGKAELVEHKADIEDFERYTSVLTQMYLTLLEKNRDTKVIVQSQFESLLKSKDETITELQEDRKTALEDRKTALEDKQKALDELKGTQKELQTDIERLKADVEKLTEEKEALISSLADKDKINAMQTQTIENLQHQITDHKKEVEQLNNLQTQLQLAKNDSELIRAENSRFKADLERIGEEHEKEIELLKAQNEVTVSKAVADVKEEYQVKLSEYQEKYFALLEQMQKRFEEPKKKAVKKADSEEE